MLKLLFMLLLLFGCAGYNADFASGLDGWVGNTPMELTAQWGLPDNQTTIDYTTSIYTYNLQAPKGEDNPYPTQFVYSAVDGDDLPPPPNTSGVYYCRVSFIIRNGIITSYNFNGDDCTVDILP